MYSKITSTHKEIIVSDFDTSNYRGLILPGSHQRKISADSGELINQEYVKDGFTLILNEGSFESPLTMVFERMPTFVHFHFAMKNKLRLDYDNREVLVIQGKYMLLHNATSSFEQRFVARSNFQHFCITYSRDFVEMLGPYVKAVEAIINDSKHKTFFPFAYSHWPSSEMLDIIRQLLNCPYEPVTRDFFFDDKAKDLLFLMLMQKRENEMLTKYLNTSDIDKIHFAHEMIMQDLTSHHDIRSLARKVGLNEFKLKVGFKQVFKAGPFTVLKEARMQLAYELLRSTDKPIKEIQFLAGYASLTSFIAAFRKFHGITPGKLRYE